MNARCLFGPLLAALAVLVAAGVCSAAAEPSLQVSIRGPAHPLRMGDTPSFKGCVTNVGKGEIRGLVVYLSLVSLEAGHEQPLDLEDWSAQKAVRIDVLQPGQSNTQDWPMRLIQAGRFGVALTVVDPREKQPVISDLLGFDVQSKPTLSSGRIVPVAVGVPALLLVLYGLRWAYVRMRRS